MSGDPDPGIHTSAKCMSISGQYVTFEVAPGDAEYFAVGTTYNSTFIDADHSKPVGAESDS